MYINLFLIFHIFFLVTIDFMDMIYLSMLFHEITIYFDQVADVDVPWCSGNNSSFFGMVSLIIWSLVEYGTRYSLESVQTQC